MHRAEHLAAEAEERLPSWLRPGLESTAPVLVALLAAMGMQLASPACYTVVPRWPLISLVLLLVVVLVAANPIRLKRHTLIGKPAIVVLLAAITADNTASAVMLDSHILTGKISNYPAVLLGGGAAIFISNVVVFGVWYWELGRGGSIARCEMKRIYPDFIFPKL